jgi:hypothetical protein
MVTLLEAADASVGGPQAMRRAARETAAVPATNALDERARKPIK